MEKVKNFWKEKVISRALTTNQKKGIIENKRHESYSQKKSLMQTIFIAENDLANLQLQTIKKIGKEAARRLWYKIGKELGYEYMLLTGTDKKLSEEEIKFIFKGFSANGCHLCDNIKISNSKIILKGKDTILCRITGLCSFFQGTAAGVMTFIAKSNFEAKCLCKNCPNVCQAIVEKRPVNMKINPKNLQKPTARRMRPLPISLGTTTFNDLVKFKKIEFTKDGASLYGQPMMACPIQILAIIAENYRHINQWELLIKIIQDNESNFVNYLVEQESLSLKNILQIYSALGYGAIKQEQAGNLIRVYIQNISGNKDFTGYMEEKIKNIVKTATHGEFKPYKKQTTPSVIALYFKKTA